MKRPLLLLLLAAPAGCGDDAPPTPLVKPIVVPFDAAPAPPPAPPPIALEPLPDGASEAAVLEEARAVSPWTAVLARGRLLARRGEHGAVFGRVGPEQGGVRWLLEETDAGRGLGIRVTTTTGGPFPATEGQRVLAHGAWTTTADLRWIFAVDRLQALGPGDAVAPTSGDGSHFLPGELVYPGEAREGDRPFVVVARPAKPGDGWTIADEKGKPPSAVLLLPGEAPIYGGLDFLSPDERWSLAPGKRYAAPVVPVKTAHKPPLPLLRATAAPVALPSGQP